MSIMKNWSCTLLSYVFERWGDVWVRYDEVQRQRCYKIELLTDILKKTGFDVLLITGGYDMSPPLRRANAFILPQEQ